MDSSPGQPDSAGGANPSGTNGVSPQRPTWADYFAFRVMVTPALIRVVYLIGAAVITVVSVFVPLGIAVPQPATLGTWVYVLLVGVVVFLVAQLWWRVITELLMVIFGIHESVRAIEARDRD